MLTVAADRGTKLPGERAAIVPNLLIEAEHYLATVPNALHGERFGVSLQFTFPC